MTNSEIKIKPWRDFYPLAKCTCLFKIYLLKLKCQGHGINLCTQRIMEKDSKNKEEPVIKTSLKWTRGGSFFSFHNDSIDYSPPLTYEVTPGIWFWSMLEQCVGSYILHLCLSNFNMNASLYVWSGSVYLWF